VLSLVSLIAYVITKIAVGIFAGGIVFATLLPGMTVELGSIVLNSFWIGSVLVVILTGLYTVLGGMRAVAYTEAIQTLILVVARWCYGLRPEHIGGWGRLREVLGPEMFNLWKPIVPAGLAGTWAPVKEAGRIAWYSTPNIRGPDAVLRAHRRALVLVHRSVHRAAHARAPDQTKARRGTIFAAFLKLLPVFIFIVPA
jgi:SSS family solute:Na+ symporter